jgi:hypothetical protein
MDARRKTSAEEILAIKNVRNLATENTEFLKKNKNRKIFSLLSFSVFSVAKFLLKIVDGFTIQNPKSKI